MNFSSSFFIVFILSILARKSIFCSIESSENTNAGIKFFSEKIDLNGKKLLGEPSAGNFHGKFIFESGDGLMSGSFDDALLQECSELNYGLIEFGQDTKKKKKMFQKFGKKLRFSFKETREREKLKNTLVYFHCIHALKSVDFEEIGAEMIINLINEFPEVMKLHLDLLPNLSDFSFLTVETVKILYNDKNEYLRPFGLDNLVKTVSKEVLLELLNIWNFNLSLQDAQPLLSIRGEDIMEFLEIEPRAWLIWRKAMIIKPFPLDLLIEKLSPENFNIYIDLIWSFIYDREQSMFHSMFSLEYLYADLHKNDPIQEMYMTEEMIAALENRKWDIWYENGKNHIALIRELMNMSFKLIAKVNEILYVVMQDQSNENVISKLIVTNTMILLRTPLYELSRTSFISSRDKEKYNEAKYSYVYHHPYAYTPTVLASNVYNPIYWQVLWTQLELLEIDLAYDVSVCTKFGTTEKLIPIIKVVWRFLTKTEGVKPLSSNYWYMSLNFLFISIESYANLDLSEKLIKSITGYMEDQLFELNPIQLQAMKTNLHPSIDADEYNMKILEARNHLLVKFRLAPVVLGREEISSLIQNPELQNLMKYSAENVMKLRFLDSFTVDDLITFFPTGASYHLESHEALYTVNPDALKEYLIRIQGAINYPDNLIFWVHPRVWENQALVDELGELIPLSIFLTYTGEADSFGLIFVIADIVGRIQRNPHKSPQKLILKWLIHMEWIFIQFIQIFYKSSSEVNFICSQYDRIIASERKSRAKLITWLKANETIEDGGILLELVEKSPLSCLRSSWAYSNFMSEAIFQANLGSKPPYLDDLFRQFSIFNSVSVAYKIRESDLEVAAHQANSNCELLIEKCFDFVEKEIWLNRLKIINFTTISKYVLKPIPESFANKFFKDQGALVHDVKTFFLMLWRSGYPSTISVHRYEDGFLKTCPHEIEVKNREVKNFQDVIFNARKRLLQNDMKKMKEVRK